MKCLLSSNDAVAHGAWIACVVVASEYLVRLLILHSLAQRANKQGAITT